MTGVILSPDMTPEEFQVWYDRLKTIDPDLNHTKLARRLEVDQPRIGKWLRGKENGGIAIMGPLRLALERLEQIMIEEQQPPKPGRPRKRRAQGSPDAT